MTGLRGMLGVAALFALSFQAVALETAGELLVDLDASTLEGYSEGNNVEAWPNTGTLPDFAFVNTHNTTTRPTYQFRNGAPAIRFAGSSTGSMTNGVPTPDSLTGNNPWTVEGWVAPTKSMTDIRYFLTFSNYNGLPDNTYTRAAFRVDQTDATAIEHYSYNLPWGRRNPEDTIYRTVPGNWYHICVVHEASGYERLYVNGRIASVGQTELRLSNEAPSWITISGICGRADTSSWTRQAYVDYGHLRVQTGALTAAQVIANYNAEKAHYGVTDTPDALWTDGGVWFNDQALALNGNLIIEGDQPLVVDNGASNAVHFLTVNASKGTGLTIDNGSMLTIDYYNNTVELGNVAGGTFSLSVPDGTFATPGNSITLGLYNTGIGVIGGREDAIGLFDIGSSLRVGHNPGGSGDLAIKTNGIVNIANTLRIADGNDAQGHITVEQGGELTVLGAAYICSGTGTGVLDVYGTFTSGTPDTTPNIYLTANSASGSGTLNFHPGSVGNISIFRVEGNVTTTTGTINIDDATIRILRQRTSLVEPPVIMNIKNRATFDIPADMTATIRTTVYDLTEGGAAEIVKTGGGTLFLTPNDGVSPSSLSSTIIVKEGQFTLGNANALVPNHGCTFKLEGGTISADYVGGASDILMHLDKSSVGNLMLHVNNAGENLDLSEFPGVALVPNGTFTYTGTITPYQNKYIFRPTGGLMVYDSDISDNANGVASVEIYGATDTDGVTLSGVNSGMTGNISVFKGILGISARSEAAGNSAFTKLYLAEGTSLKLDARLDDGFLTSRVDPASKPAAILLTDNSARCNVDLSLFPGCRLGTDKTDTIMVQTGAIFPNADNVYLLGGGGLPYYQTSHPGFQPSAMADTATGPARVEVGSVGIVNLSNSANAYSGGTSIIDGGAVFATADGFGAVPTEFDEDNIYINGGILRNANSNFALAATRGVKVGPDGAELHPWGTYSVDIRGGLTGAGPVRITDGGLITLSGANNTFQGPITVTQANQQLTIGSDEVFSWASTDGISTPGKVILKNGGNDTFNDVISGTGSLVKRGEGCMTLAQSQSYTGGTVVEGGALVLPDGVKLANSSSFFNNGEVVFSTLDALGLGIISGNGLFTVAGDVVLDTSRITGSQSFEVLDGAALDIDEPAFGEKSEVRLDDGARMTLGGCYVSKVDGFEAFSLNGSATLADGNLVLTPNTIGVSGSAFYPSQILISKPWSVSFTYQAGAHDEWTTDLLGAALVLQNDAAGPDALGAASSGAALGCTFAKSIGVIMRVGVESDTRNRYGFSNAGSITDDTSARSNAVAADGGNPIKITVSYDGSNLHAEWNCNGTVRTRDWTVDLAASLGSEFAWIGFTGATGASTGCEQTISNFAFGKSGATLSGINETDWTHSKYPATYTTLDDQPAFELTSNEGYKRSAVWNSTRINVTQPFRATFKYRVTACSTPPADGMAIAIQNYSSNAGDCYGADGGAVGLVYGTPRERTVGWAVNLYQGVNDQCFKYVLAGNFSGDTVPLTDWDLANGQDTEFTLTYDLYSLTLTATRNGVSISASRVVDLASAVGGDSAWIGFTGATGGSTARQVVYDFTFAYEEIDTSCYGNAFVVEGAAQMNLGEGTVAFGNLTLLDGADLAVGSAADSRLELAGTTLAGGATVTSSSAPIILSDTIAFDSATGILKLVGDVSASGKVALKLSSYNGSRDLIDLTEATTSLTEDDFEVTGDVSPLVKVGIRNGKVRVWRDDATIIILH